MLVKNIFLKTSSLISLGLLFSYPALTQVIPDTTLQNNSSITTEGNTNIINGGTQAGDNLFHSFEQFSIPTNGTAQFNNSIDIQNIFSRVTGGSISNIDGLIRANGAANLFLINPNGIIFGSNARLDIGGSFIGSTVSSVNFGDGRQSSASQPQATPLLTINVPTGLRIEKTNSGEIRIQDTDHDLSLSYPMFVPFTRRSIITGANSITDTDLVKLPVDINNLIAQGCPGDIPPGASSVVYLRRSGLPEDPTQPLTPSVLWTDLSLLTEEPQTSEPPDTESTTESTKLTTLETPLVAATGMVRGKDGNVILTAANPATIDIPWVKPTCHASSP